MVQTAKHKITLFWLRRDLRLNDNRGLAEALNDSKSVLPIFIFDQEILARLKNPKDRRVNFIHNQVEEIKNKLQMKNSDLLVEHGAPLDIFSKILRKFQIQAIYTNHDYEPQARVRDQKIADFCQKNNVIFKTFKDQAIFEKNEILTDQKKPYTVYTPYKKKWLATLSSKDLRSCELNEKNFLKLTEFNFKPQNLISIEKMGFKKVEFKFPQNSVSNLVLQKYNEQRDFPHIKQGTSRLGLHFRFGTISIREWAEVAQKNSDTWLSELIWRDFFMQILWHFPHVENSSFRLDYEKIKWRESEKDFKAWSLGMTGYPLVDAGMRELNTTGHMHNRVRMVVASFLCKHLLIHWRQGERYFAEHLLDYDLAANSGNWQWAAGTGCDAAPYFRIFNPMTQAIKFDPENIYIGQWVPEYGTDKYPKPIIDHAEARGRCLQEFQKGLKG